MTFSRFRPSGIQKRCSPWQHFLGPEMVCGQKNRHTHLFICLYEKRCVLTTWKFIDFHVNPSLATNGNEQFVWVTEDKQKVVWDDDEQWNEPILLRVCDYLHMPTDNRQTQTDKHLRLVMTLLPLCCTEVSHKRLDRRTDRQTDATKYITSLLHDARDKHTLTCFSVTHCLWPSLRALQDKQS